MELSYLTWLWLLPAVAGLGTLVSEWMEAGSAKSTALAGAALVLGYALWLGVPFSGQDGLWRLQEEGMGGAVFGIRYVLAADGVSLTLCWLNALLTLLALAASWKGGWPAGYWASFLLLESAVMGVFVVRDLFYFFVFWEAGLIPMFFIVGLWGSEGRRHAALKFLLYTVSGSLLMLVGILSLVTLNHEATGAWTWELGALAGAPVDPATAPWLWLAIAAGFAVKVPLWPLHNWLPDAHTEAPAAGSVLLAGVMLKMGVYGFLRVLLPVFPDLSRAWMPAVGALAVFNILYGALCAMAQSDLKRLVAYSSISHLGFCMLGLFSFTPQGISGGTLQMLNHGLSTGALFLMIGMMYDRTHRRGVGDFGDLASRAPQLAFLFGLVSLASIGLPGLNGFVGEAMALAGMATVLPVLAAAGLGGAVLAAAYLLPAYQRVFWAPAGKGSASAKVHDLDAVEGAVLWTLAALIVWIGLYPAPLLRILEPSSLALSR